MKEKLVLRLINEVQEIRKIPTVEAAKVVCRFRAFHGNKALYDLAFYIQMLRNNGDYDSIPEALEHDLNAKTNTLSLTSTHGERRHISSLVV